MRCCNRDSKIHPLLIITLRSLTTSSCLHYDAVSICQLTIMRNHYLPAQWLCPAYTFVWKVCWLLYSGCDGWWVITNFLWYHVGSCLHFHFHFGFVAKLSCSRSSGIYSALPDNYCFPNYRNFIPFWNILGILPCE